MNILFMNKLNSYWKDKIIEIKKLFPETEFINWQDVKDLPEIINKVDAVVYGENLTESLLKKFENLKVIFVPYAGVNQLPLELLKEKGIMVSNSHGNARVVAEKALSLAFALLGKIVVYHKDLEKGIWHGFSAGESVKNSWVSIQSKRCGVLGLGNIGRNLAQMLKAFDCRVIGYKRNLEMKIDYVDEITDDLNYVIQNSDIIFVTLPLTKYTKGLINQEAFSKMQGKYLINVGRGDVIDQKALYDALASKTIAGAAIDVWYNYPSKDKPCILPSNYPIHNFDNVVLSPHVAGYNTDATKYSIDRTIENIKSFLENGEPKDLIDLEYGY
ncbi:2-hydroxyacid dehydrogenase [Petrotoga sp. 9PW.55.5.1]|uniref:2-hydroxyacid dehydrogenase n=1 Tax=Petrotoga sp. 9PW.55.5.1 TaxID=1308979 RepID=UPI000DC33E81|nr:2-hydroxyacid dehydrogenase [Petrotoga sp. 9PW.55.5.1]RAO99883.1 2-hydroxyacid dehydrogenase [Petrotoga sp. 9PW.55.5.1]